MDKETMPEAPPVTVQEDATPGATPPEGTPPVEGVPPVVDGEAQETAAPLDPGNEEGVIAKKEHEPSSDHPRFKEIYAEAKENGRKLGEANEKIAKMETGYDALREHNSKLAGKVEVLVAQGSQAPVPPVPPVETFDFDANKEKIAELKEKKKGFLDDTELRKADDVQDEIEELQEKAKEAKATPPVVAPPPPAPSAPELVPEVQQAINKFIADTPWYDNKTEGFQPLMAGEAERLDSLIKDKPEWANKPMSERLDYVKAQVEKKFSYETPSAPETVPDPNAPTPPPTVGGVAPPEGGDQGGIKLTADQMHVAEGMFYNETKEDAYKLYAAQVALSS